MARLDRIPRSSLGGGLARIPHDGSRVHSPPACASCTNFLHGTVEFLTAFSASIGQGSAVSTMRGGRATLLLHVRARLVQGQKVVWQQQFSLQF